MEGDAAPRQLSVPDIVALSFAAFSLGWAVVTVWIVQPSFIRMFAEVGGNLSTFTRLCLRPAFPLALGVTPLAVALWGILRAATRKARRRGMVLAILLALTVPGMLVAGLFLPMLSMAAAAR